MSEGGGGGGASSLSDDAVAVENPSTTQPAAAAPRSPFSAFVEAALADVSTAAGSCRGAHYKDVKAACQAALGAEERR